MLTGVSLPASERALYSKLHLILQPPGLIRGSLVTMGRTCGQETCHCHRDRKFRHRALYVAVNLGGKRRMLYVPRDWEERVREWVDRHRQVRAVLDRLSRACLKRLRDRQK